MIREAVSNDIDDILVLCEEFWKHTIYEDDFDAEHTRLMVNLAQEHGLLGVLTENDKVVGFIAGVKSPLLANPNVLTGTELAWWVEPDYRKGRKGISLMLFIESLAKQQGIKYWNMISMESSNPDVANKIYERLGYKKTETSFTKEL
jgi:ribosomal protein S18 acetylase RimI-like enzyme